jgi:hypothetical protein
MQSVFVSCPFHGPYKELIAKVREAADHYHLRTVSVDQRSVALPLTEEIVGAVKESRVVVADITGKNPNVLHEVGLAQAYGKPLILITQDAPSEAPFNIRNLRMIEYGAADLLSLERRIEAALQEVLFPDDLLRSMIVPRSLGSPTRDSRFVLAASPLSWRRATNRSGGYSALRRTESDYVGIRGIYQAFGQFYGFETLPEQIDPEDYRDHVAEEPMNLYCIASPKANRWTRTFLEAFGKRWAPKREFRPDPTSTNLRNVWVSLLGDNDVIIEPENWDRGTGDRYYRDYGIIVRGPNPFDPDRHMFAVLAGRSSLGTQAACTAFTDTEAVKYIIETYLHPRGIDIEDHRQPFYALVSMERRHDDKEEAIPESLLIRAGGPFSARTPMRARPAVSEF